MPVVKRLVEPIHCSRAPIPKGMKNELEAVTVNTLSGVILQLSSLSKHAEGIFAELFNEANSIHQRTCSAQQRIEQLAIKITKLDSAGEEISLQEINMQKAFKLTVHSDQQVISRQTMPEAMMESYSRCDQVPNLEALTQFRHDGKDALKFYTDPSYFFELWKQKMSVELEKRRKRKKRGHRGKKRDVEKKEVKGVKKKEVSKNIPDWEIQDRTKQQTGNAVISQSPQYEQGDIISPIQSNRSSDASINKSGLSPRRQSTKRASNASYIGRPSSAPPPPPPPPPSCSPAKTSGATPPPPPPLPGQQMAPRHKPMSPPPPPPSMLNQITSQDLPPPPYLDSHPPPPPLSMTGAPPPPPPGMPAPPPPPPTGNVIQNVVRSAPKHPPEPVPDGRNDLLTAIRHGMNLRQTEQVRKEEKKDAGMGNDVASILARRIAVEFSDSEEDDSDFTDDDDWSDEE